MYLPVSPLDILILALLVAARFLWMHMMRISAVLSEHHIVSVKKAANQQLTSVSMKVKC